MKKFLAIVGLALTCISGFAQNEVGSLFVTPKIGLSAANMSTFDKSDYRLGFTAGAELAVNSAGTPQRLMDDPDPFFL